MVRAVLEAGLSKQENEGRAQSRLVLCGDKLRD